MGRAEFSNTGFLASASGALRKLMTDLAKPHVLETGEVLFSQGDLGDTLYAVTSGRLEISVLSPDGAKLTLAILGKGDLLGEIALFAPGARTATVTALETSKVWGVKNPDVLKALRVDTDLQMDMIELAGMRMRSMGQQYAEQVFMDVPTRLARRILHLVGPTDTSLKMSQTDLASFVGATRETVSKTLAIWKKDGIISLGRGTIVILDHARMKEISEGTFC